MESSKKLLLNPPTVINGGKSPKSEKRRSVVIFFKIGLEKDSFGNLSKNKWGIFSEKSLKPLNNSVLLNTAETAIFEKKERF